MPSEGDRDNRATLKLVVFGMYHAFMMLSQLVLGPSRTRHLWCCSPTCSAWDRLMESPQKLKANTDTLPLQAANRVMRRVTSEKEYTPLASVDHHKLQALDADNRQDFPHWTSHQPITLSTSTSA